MAGVVALKAEGNVCGGEMLGFLFRGDWIKSVGRISLESWGEGAS